MGQLPPRRRPGRSLQPDALCTGICRITADWSLAARTRSRATNVAAEDRNRMNRQKLIIALVALALIGGTAGLLANLRSHQKLGPPAVKTSPLDDTIRVQVELPERVLDYESTNVPIEQIVFDILPKDTSLG